MMEPRKSFGRRDSRRKLSDQLNINRIRERMEVLGLSQNKFADAVGLTPGAVSRVMARKRGISQSTAQRFAEVLGLNTGDLYGTPVDLNKTSEAISEGAWSIKALADAVGVTPDHLSLALQRRRNLTPEAWKRLAETLGLDYKDVVTDLPKDEPPTPPSPAEPNPLEPVAARRGPSHCERCGSVMLPDEFKDPRCSACGHTDYSKAKPGPPTAVRPTVPQSSAPAGFKDDPRFLYGPGF